MFRRAWGVVLEIRERLSHFDWTAIVGSFLLLVFMLLVVCPAISILDRYEHETNAANEQQRNNKGRYVLPPESANDRVAEYTLWLTIFTALLVGVSAWQGYLILRAERGTQKALQTGADQAEAAKIQAKVMVAQIQPFIALTGPCIQFQADRENNVPAIIDQPGRIESNMYAVVSIHNAGGGNARITAVSADWYLGPSDPPEIPIRLSYIPTFQILLPAHGYALRLVESKLVLTGNQLQRIQSGTDKLWFYGTVRYMDALEETYEQGFIAHWEELPTQGRVIGRGLVVEGPAAYNSLMHTKKT
jgi:hypothetical protein